jgi:predicted amidohydrolase YtcJ
VSDPRDDLILIADRVHASPGSPPAEALLLRGGRVAALGSASAMRDAALHGARTERIAGTVTPGLVDAHIHLTTWALSRGRVQLHGAATLEEGLKTVRAAVAEGEGWIRGVGWDRNRWGALPTRAPLDAVTGARPAYLLSHDIHAAWLNGEALRRCGIDRDTPDPDGGEIVRDGEGEPTGILLERAVTLAEPYLPVESPGTVRAALIEAQRALHGFGVTGVHSVEVTGLADFAAMEADGDLRLRVLQAIPLARLDEAIALGLRSGFGSEWLRIGGVKLFLDGALGSRTAAMREPYRGTESDRGIRTLDDHAFRTIVERAAAAGIATTVHAIGDAAVAAALDVLAAVPPPGTLPHRIEHLQLCPPDLWARAGRTGIVGSMQPIHLVHDIPAADRHWGHPRCRGAYAFRGLLGAGMTLAFGSDAPVESCDPRPGLAAAILRVDDRGGPEGGWYPEHALTAEQVLAGYTLGPAVAAGTASRQGRLLPGCDADLAVWDRDPLGCTPDELHVMRCVRTMIGGETVFAEDV